MPEGWTEDRWAQYLTPYRYEHCEECGETLSVEGVPMNTCEHSDGDAC